MNELDLFKLIYKLFLSGRITGNDYHLLIERAWEDYGTKLEFVTLSEFPETGETLLHKSYCKISCIDEDQELVETIVEL